MIRKRIGAMATKVRSFFSKHKKGGRNHWNAGKWSCTDKDYGMSYEPSLWSDGLCIVVASADEDVVGVIYNEEGEELATEWLHPSSWTVAKVHDSAQKVSRKLGGPTVPLKAIQKIWKLKGW